jgi:lysyl endopeptidase
MSRTSLSLFGLTALTAILVAACSSVPADEKADSSEAFAQTSPGQEVLVLPPMGARSANDPEAKDGIHKFAESVTLSATPSNAGKWDSPSPGVRRWRFTVERAGSLSQNFGFTRFKMPQGGKLSLIDESGKRVASFTDRDNKPHGELWTPIAPGIRATIEVTVPSKMEPFLELSLTRVNSAFRSFQPTPGERSGSCNKDVVCAEGDDWRNEIRSVAVISLGGSTMCTGQLLNDAAGDGKPYFLTAMHCGVKATNAASLVVYWNYQTSTCGGAPDGQLNQFQTGSIFRAARSASDFTLVELDDAPDPAHDVFWSGWDARDSVPQSAVAIHHPATDEKRISFENQPLSVSTYIQDASPGDGTHLRVADWDVGTTEPGSSGSGLWNAEHRLVGQLHGGYAACGNDRADWYGWFNKSWDAGTSSADRLKDWLDATNTGATFVDGKGGCARPTVDFTTSPNPATLGQQVTATAVVSGGTGPYTMSWDMNGDGTADCTGENCAFTYGAEFDGSATLTVTDATNCSAVVRRQQTVTDPSLCPAGFDSSDVPKAIPDNSAAGVTSTLEIPAPGTAQKAKVSFHVEHTYVGDLKVSLISPSGREIVLHANAGGGADNITVTDKEVPELNGQPITGAWKLKAVDSAGQDTGKLVSWKLTFRTACAPTGG